MNFHVKTYIVTFFCLAIIALGFFLHLLNPSVRSTLPTPDAVTTASTTTPLISSEVSTTTVGTSTISAPSNPTLPSVPAATRVTTASVIAGMNLTFEDNFNTFSRYVDAKGNITCNPDGTGIWQTVYHFCSRTIPSNYESEIYIDQSFIDYLQQTTGTTSAITNPISTNGGVLTIEAKPADPAITKAAGAWAKYTSGLITTQYSFSQQYGYFEMRAQMPAGEGLWPAFWLLPIDKSWPPEIDVMEAFGGKNARNEGGLTNIHYASHTVKNEGLCGAWHDVGTDITAGYHTYGVNWQKDTITYFFDGVAYATCPGNPDANQPFYLLVNLAVGSTPSWPGAPDATTKWPAHMNIDYVRAYQTK